MRTLWTVVITSLVFVAVAVAAPKAGKKAKHSHHDAHAMVKDKLKKNGKHELHKNGKHSVSAEVKDGKIASFSVKHDTKGDVPVKKFKSKTKVSSIEGAPSEGQPADSVNLGTTWIAYAYENDDGDWEYYWFPYDMIMDGDTGAIEYVPA
jgi:hypothetical protein